MAGSAQRVGAVIRKEVKHIVRDWQTLLIVMAMPVIMMFLYGYALTLDFKEIRCVVIDPSSSSASRYITNAVDASTMFSVLEVIDTDTDVLSLFRKNRVKAVIRFPADLDRRLRAGGTAATIQVLIDGSDQNLGTVVRNAVQPAIRTAVIDYLGIEPPGFVDIRVQVLYNPQQRSALFFVPGLMAIILMMISALLTSLTITREKELGTLEQLLVSPLKPREILMGKLLPYVIIAAIDALLIVVVGRIFFGVNIRGSLILLSVSSVIYVTTALSLGMIFSSIAETQQQAMMMVLPVTLLPTVILSGFIFPLSSMPLFLQWFAHILPATYFLEVVRGIILKGTGLTTLWQPLLVLTSMAIIFFGIALKKFEKT